eukprot:3609889-Prymnesium_polylepis.1
MGSQSLGREVARKRKRPNRPRSVSGRRFVRVCALRLYRRKVQGILLANLPRTRLGPRIEARGGGAQPCLALYASPTRAHHVPVARCRSYNAGHVAAHEVAAEPEIELVAPEAAAGPCKLAAVCLPEALIALPPEPREHRGEQAPVGVVAPPESTPNVLKLQDVDRAG